MPHSDRSLPWLDRLKALALAWVVLNHVVERIAGGAAAGNPNVDWPPLAARIAQFNPVGGMGLFDWPLTLVRDLGWFGDQGVTLFLILSGFGLTYGLLARNAANGIDAGEFYLRRGFRILPLWWGAHVLFLPLGILTATMTPADWQFYASLAGLRFLPSVFYFFSPAWWYIGLLLQLYLVYPLLWRILRARGATTLLTCCCAVGFGAIALGPYLFHSGYLDAWQRGAFFVTRLPEFGLGMALGAWWHRRPEKTEALLRSPVTALAGIVLYSAGTWASFTLTGMIVAPLLLGAGALALLFPFVAYRAHGDDALQRVGRHSYSLYLTHDPLIAFLVPAAFTGSKTVLAIVLALVATVIAAFILERATAAVERLVGAVAARYGGALTASAGLFVVAALYGVAVAGDLAVQRLAPQEVLGWGERASLQPSARFGWNLIPSRTTRLRWQSYDYRVKANALGFPGPEFSSVKPAGALRILVTGDAYSSAEGVDTALGWPRLLQGDMAAGGRRDFQVMNFSITGYGPRQEAAVVAAFAPRFHPDIILIEMFANDVADALTSDAAFRSSIGFGEPSQTGFRSILELRQLSAYLHAHVAEPIHSFVRHKPAAEGYFLGNVLFLQRGHPEFDRTGVRRAIASYRAIERSARAIGAQTIVAFVPAPVQVCGPRSLAYYPRFVDLHDASKFDLTLPQRRGRAIAAAAGVTFWDLTPQLQALARCPYMPHNMHFTAGGNRAVAALLARRLTQDLAVNARGAAAVSNRRAR